MSILRRRNFQNIVEPTLVLASLDLSLASTSSGFVSFGGSGSKYCRTIKKKHRTLFCTVSTAIETWKANAWYGFLILMIIIIQEHVHYCKKVAKEITFILKQYYVIRWENLELVERLWCLIFLQGVGVGLHDKVLRVGVQNVRQGHDVVQGGNGQGLLLIRVQSRTLLHQYWTLLHQYWRLLLSVQVVLTHITL